MIKEYLKNFDTHAEYLEYLDSGEMIVPNVSHCEDVNDVHYNQAPKTNGHEYVDLGLPSGTLWATMNVGANSVTDYGYYFAWGETQGYVDTSVKSFTWGDYELSSDDSGSPTSMTKYNSTDGLTRLEPNDDAAHVNWGGDWCMPTSEQCQELVSTANTTSEYVSLSGVSGFLFTSKTNGNTIFFPANGAAVNGNIVLVGTLSTCYANTISSTDFNMSWMCNFSGDMPSVTDNADRFAGSAVRGIINKF